jgi:hypothetical protein
VDHNVILCASVVAKADTSLFCQAILYCVIYNNFLYQTKEDFKLIPIDGGLKIGCVLLDKKQRRERCRGKITRQQLKWVNHHKTKEETIHRNSNVDV